MATATKRAAAATSAAADEALWFLHDRATVRLRGDQTDGRLGIVEVEAPRGDQPPLHRHLAEDETFVVLEGALRLWAGDVTVDAEAGSVVSLPRGVPHTYRVESERARMLVLSTPAGFESFVAAVGEPAGGAGLPPAGPPVGLERLPAAAAEHGIELLAPPGTLP